MRQSDNTHTSTLVYREDEEEQHSLPPYQLEPPRTIHRIDHSSESAYSQIGDAHEPSVYSNATTDEAHPPGDTGVTCDGRIDIDLTSRLAKTLTKLVPEATTEPSEPSRRLTVYRTWKVRMNIVIQVVGSRGDVQPFIALGQELQKYGHRVRLATHNTFESFVREANLEFYPIGGDPKELMAYMVKNPGLIPSMKSLREGDIQRKRDMITEILRGCWDSCVEPDLQTQHPFVADAIIANPPSFAHIHCAEALGVPLHIMFTMPWSSTRAFPHPLANFKAGEIDPALINYASYGIVEWLTWQGLGDIINKFRGTLDLEPVPTTVGPLLAEVLEIPFTYCWSPALVPKPNDWPSHIDVCGFFFRDPAPYHPPADLEKFLQAGPPPVYIGFGSIVLEEPEKMTAIILEAVRLCGVRAMISRGWSNLGQGFAEDTKDVLFIDDCPHEWLFQHVAAVVHHGGAGTVACGLRNACPTFVVPFFGDQPFWGEMIMAAGAGPKPIAQKSLSSQNLAGAIHFCLSPETKTAAQRVSLQMQSEDGVKAAVQSFHANLPLEAIPCSVVSELPAAWIYKKSNIRLSKLVAHTLVDNYIISQDDLNIYKTHVTHISNNRWDPVTSTGSAGMSVVKGMGTATKDMIYNPYKEINRSKSEDPVHPVKVAGRVATSGAKGFGKFNIALFKGAIVDIPLAATEGFRAIPKLYGEEVKSYGEVTDVKSGFTVAGRNFTHGMYDGFSDLFVRPYEDAKNGSAIGLVKGIGKGLAGFTSKTASASLGLVAYPGSGICKSIRYAANTGSRRDLKSRKIHEGEHLARHSAMGKDVDGLINTFNLLRVDGRN